MYSTTARAHLSHERWQPGDLWIASRWVLRTRQQILGSALRYLDDKIVPPLRRTRVNGYPSRLVDDTAHTFGQSRVLEVAAALINLDDAGLDAQVLIALRATPWVADEDAFAATAMGMTPAEAVAHADANTFPDRSTMLTVAALRGINLYSIYDDLVGA